MNNLLDTILKKRENKLKEHVNPKHVVMHSCHIKELRRHLVDIGYADDLITWKDLIGASIYGLKITNVEIIDNNGPILNVI